MSGDRIHLDEVGRLAGLLLADAIDPGDFRRLEQMLLTDREAMDYYQRYVEIHSLLHWHHCPDDENRNENCDDERLDEADCGQEDVVVRFPSLVGWSGRAGTLSCFVSALMLFLMVLIAWELRIADYEGGGMVSAAAVDSVHNGKLIFVGRITGMVDCRWAKDESPPARLDYVAIGRRFQLDSGLLEITYDSGAKVILEGPANYEVCANGGFLFAGKATGRLENDGDDLSQDTQQGREESETVESSGSLAVPPLPAAFAIRTPAAVIANLGAEFGMEVDREKCTVLHVFHGLAEVSPVAALEGQRELVLSENESVRVKIGEDQVSTFHRAVTDPNQFIRQIQGGSSPWK
jgi:hypothetical protein